jgi:Ferritin-like domain
MLSTVKFNQELTRRSALKTMGIVGAVAALRPSAISAATEKAAAEITDADIFNFALNLESLETEYYLRGTMGKGMDDADAGENPGPVSGGNLVPWQKPDLRQFMEEVANNELAHVRYYRRVLGKKAVSRPEIDLGAFTAAAKAAGLGDNFDPFASEMNFFLGGMLMEDVGVTAYHGAAPLIKNKEFLDAAAGILAVEAYHMGMARSVLYQMGPQARDAANALSDARDKLDGPEDVDQGIVMDDHANIVPSNKDGQAFSRTPQQVLRIVYLADKSGISRGGLFPNGMNGALKTT